MSEYVLRNPESEPVPLDRDYHGEQCDWLMAKTKKRKLLLASRGTLKSTVSNRNFIIWLIINNPNVTVLITSSTLDNAKKKLKAIKDTFEKNKLFRSLFPEILPQTFNENWAQAYIQVPRTSTDPEPTVECQSVEGELTSRHYDWIVDDDIVSPSNTNTADLIKKTKNFHTQSLQLLKKPHGSRITIGTLWHFSDLHCHILENMYETYDILVRSVYKNNRYIRNKETGIYEWKTIGPKTSLYPALMSDTIVEELKREILLDPLQGMSTWMKQYEMKIVNDENAKFKKDLSNDDDFWFKESDLIGKKLSFTLTLDPAISENKQADESAFTVVARDETDTWYVIEVFALSGMDEDAIIAKWIELLIKYPIDLCTIESIAFQRVLKYVIEKECKVQRVYLPFMKLPAGHSQASKNNSELKILGLAPIYAAKKIKFKIGCTEQADLLAQLWTFPASAKDDRIDSLAMHIHLPVYATKIWIKDPNIIKTDQSIDRYGYKKQQRLTNSHYI